MPQVRFRGPARLAGASLRPDPASRCQGTSHNTATDASAGLRRSNGTSSARRSSASRTRSSSAGRWAPFARSPWTAPSSSRRSCRAASRLSPASSRRARGPPSVGPTRRAPRGGPRAADPAIPQLQRLCNIRSYASQYPGQEAAVWVGFHEKRNAPTWMGNATSRVYWERWVLRLRCAFRIAAALRPGRAWPLRCETGPYPSVASPPTHARRPRAVWWTRRPACRSPSSWSVASPRLSSASTPSGSTSPPSRHKRQAATISPLFCATRCRCLLLSNKQTFSIHSPQQHSSKAALPFHFDVEVPRLDKSLLQSGISTIKRMLMQTTPPPVLT